MRLSALISCACHQHSFRLCLWLLLIQMVHTLVTPGRPRRTYVQSWRWFFLHSTSRERLTALYSDRDSRTLFCLLIAYVSYLMIFIVRLNDLFPVMGERRWTFVLMESSLRAGERMAFQLSIVLNVLFYDRARNNYISRIYQRDKYGIVIGYAIITCCCACIDHCVARHYHLRISMIAISMYAFSCSTFSFAGRSSRSISSSRITRVETIFTKMSIRAW